jgi:hypothetical protein
MPDGTYFLNEDIILTLNVPQNYIDTQVNEQLKEIERRLISFRGSKEYDRELCIWCTFYISAYCRSRRNVNYNSMLFFNHGRKHLTAASISSNGVYI